VVWVFWGSTPPPPPPGGGGRGQLDPQPMHHPTTPRGSATSGPVASSDPLRIFLSTCDWGRLAAPSLSTGSRVSVSVRGLRDGAADVPLPFLSVQAVALPPKHSGTASLLPPPFRDGLVGPATPLPPWVGVPPAPFGSGRKPGFFLWFCFWTNIFRPLFLGPPGS